MGAGAGAEEVVVGRVGSGLNTVGAVIIGDDEEFLEQLLVQDPAHIVEGSAVNTGAPFGDIQRETDEVIGLGQVSGERVEPAGDSGEFGVEVALFGAEHVNGDSVVVWGFEDLAPTVFNALFGRLELFPFFVGVSAKPLQPLPEDGFEVSAEVGAEGHPVVEVLDEVFGVLDLDGAKREVGPFGVSATAEVVRIGHTVAVGKVLDEHAVAALAAKERRLQVVIMLDGPFPVDLRFQNRMDRLEHFAVNERFVAAGVLDTTEHGDAGVVRVGQHRVDVPVLDGLLG